MNGPVELGVLNVVIIMTCKYPDKKQIKRKTEDFLRSLNQYHLGMCTPQMLRNELQCLFTDTMLDMMNKHPEMVGPESNFKQLLAQW